MSQKFRRFKKLSAFDGRKIRLITKYGEAEPGRAEQGLQIGEYVFFIRDIKSIELCE